MNRILGIFGLVVFIFLFTSMLSDSFNSPQNLYNVTRWSALYGIIGIGAAFVIITGGIDLSTGSLICLVGCLLAKFIMDHEWSIAFSIAAVMTIAVLLGLFHGLMVTKLQIQPFIVTLSGFLIYRGMARSYCDDQPMGFRQDHDGLRQLALGKPWVGFEHNLAMFAGVVGAALSVFLVVRWAWLRSNKLSGQRATISLLPFALIVAFAGFSQLIGGDDTLVLKVGSYPIPIAPQSLFFHLGLIAFLPLAGCFIWSGLSSNFVKNGVPTAVLLALASMFTFVAWKVAPLYSELSPNSDSVRDIGFITISDALLSRLIMLIVFVLCAALMAAIGWLIVSVARTSATGKALQRPTILSGMIVLVGLTKLPETALPMPLLILIGCAILASVFLNQTIYGRYLLALGRNEEAARYSGINTDRMTILAYVICAALSGLAAILFALDINNMQPANHGFLYELYAIAAAVLGGCSLRGGEGTVVGVIIGAALVRLLYNMNNNLGIKTQLDWVVIGVVILAGVVADELLRRFVEARRRQRLQAAES